MYPSYGNKVRIFKKYKNSCDAAVGVFGNLSGTLASSAFVYTFYGCGSLTGPSARNPDGTPLYKVFPDATTNNVRYMYRGATELSDYADIPAAWK